jgi:hypothetical protein
MRHDRGSPHPARRNEEASELQLGARLDEAERSSAEALACSLAGDILYGGSAIAEFLYGDAKCRRKVYNLVERDRLPHFNLGAGLCARKSVLLQWIRMQENTEN